MAKSIEEIAMMTEEERAKYYKKVEVLRKNNQKRDMSYEKLSASAKKRVKTIQENKRIQSIANEWLNSMCVDFKAFCGIAVKMGVDPQSTTIKELFTLSCLLNTINRGDLADLEKMQKLLGEETLNTSAQMEERAQLELVKAIKGLSAKKAEECESKCG